MSRATPAISASDCDRSCIAVPVRFASLAIFRASQSNSSGATACSNKRFERHFVNSKRTFLHTRDADSDRHVLAGVACPSRPTAQSTFFAHYRRGPCAASIPYDLQIRANAGSWASTSTVLFHRSQPPRAPHSLHARRFDRPRRGVTESRVNQIVRTPGSVPATPSLEPHVRASSILPTR